MSDNRSNDRFYSYEEAKQVVRKLGIKTYREWCAYASPFHIEFGPNNQIIRKGAKKKEEMRDPRLPSDPANFYKRRGKWKGWGDFLGTGAVANSQKKYLSYEDARALVHSLKISSIEEYKNFVKELGPTMGLPSFPNIYYSRKGVKFSWSKFLHPKFPTYEEAKAILAVRDDIVSAADYRKARKEDPEIRRLPGSPNKYYKDKWVSWMDYLDSERKRIRKKLKIIKSERARALEEVRRSMKKKEEGQ